MKRVVQTLRFIRVGAVAIVAGALAMGAGGEKRSMDFGQSHLIVHVGKTGVLGLFGHQPVISAPIVRGEVGTSNPTFVWFDVDATGMKVVSGEESDSNKAQVQETMLGPSVLDVAHYPQIHFASDSIEIIGEGHWLVHGQLTLHGQTHPISLETILEKGHYRGTATIQQTTFGITPTRVAGGTIRVKDEVQIAYDIVLAGQ
jgi:polyisoprenoid-binding protein YceI